MFISQLQYRYCLCLLWFFFWWRHNPSVTHLTWTLWTSSSSITHTSGIKSFCNCAQSTVLIYLHCKHFFKMISKLHITYGQRVARHFSSKSSGGILHITSALIVRSRKLSKPRDLYSELYDRSEFDRHLRSSDADVPVKFQSDVITQTDNLAASRLHDILG